MLRDVEATGEAANVASAHSRPNRVGLNDLLSRAEFTTIVEVHSGLSARLADAAGFEALWASGFSISSLMGLRDSNEASWTQLLEVIEWITDATQRPLLVDGDTGHGNFNNARRLATKLADRGAAGVCIEDKLFPKTNSFIGDAQALADVEEFCGRISAAKDACVGREFTIVARTEALIAGRSMEEALDRAAAYHAAGADAILIHSKQTTAHEVFEFARRWARAAPLVVVPTTYPDVDQDELRQAGVSALIWANHGLRASALAITDLYADIKQSGRPSARSRMVSMQDIFTLLGYSDLDQDELRYLPGARAC